jgi:dTDP-4-dehydrorhamnose reductase
MAKSILITGANGQVGHELAIAEGAHRLVALDRQQLDITDPVRIEAVLDEHRPDIVINAAAYTQVDRAEHESELAFAVNRDGVANLAFACEKSGLPMLQVSTDYVFDGSKQGAYLETDPVAPLGVYGESKAEGEAILRATLERHLVLRTSWVFSASGNNFVDTMLRLGKERDELGIVDDQHGCPTSAGSIAGVLLQIAERYLRGDEIDWGTYHYCNSPATTWYGFACEIFRQASGYERLKLKPISTSEYPTPAARPPNSVLDCTRLESAFGIDQVSWTNELQQVLDQTRD